VLAGLLVALDQRGRPATLPDLEARPQRAVEGIKTLADYVAPLLPDRAGQKAGVGDLLANTVEALLALLVEAVRALWQARRADDGLIRPRRWRVPAAAGSGQLPAPAFGQPPAPSPREPRGPPPAIMRPSGTVRPLARGSRPAHAAERFSISPVGGVPAGSGSPVRRPSATAAIAAATCSGTAW
jgi:hypothetical protein